MTLDVHRIRKDFPILERKVYGKPLVYLDNAATSQKPRQVIDALVDYYENYNGNIHRAGQWLGEEATAAYEEARAKVARFINAPSPECVIFTRNTTEAINLVAFAWGRDNVREGDEILLTQMEHHSNLIPWQRLAAEKGPSVRYIELTDSQTLALDGLENLFGARTRIAAMPHVSNSLGTINPVEKSAAEARRNGTLFLADEVWMTVHALTRRSQLEDVVMSGPAAPRERGGVVSSNFGGLHPHEIGPVLDPHGVAIRAAHHSPQPLMRTRGVAGTARASLYV